MIIAPIPCFLLNLIRIFGNILCTLNGITERLSSEREGFVDRFISQNCLPISALMKSDKLAFTDRGPTLLKGLMSLCLIIKRNLEERL